MNSTDLGVSAGPDDAEVFPLGLELLLRLTVVNKSRGVSSSTVTHSALPNWT